MKTKEIRGKFEEVIRTAKKNGFEVAAFIRISKPKGDMETYVHVTENLPEVVKVLNEEIDG